MKILSILIFIFINCRYVSIQISSTIHNKLKLQTSISEKLSRSSEEMVATNVLKLDDLNDDVLLEITHTFSFDDFLSFAVMNQKFRELVIRYPATHKLRISERFIKIHPKDKNSKKTEFRNHEIIINDYQLAFKFLRNFGQIISKIMVSKLDYYGGKSWYDEIDKYINEYCFDSLKELHIDSIVNTTDAWKKPFKNLIIISISENLFNCHLSNFSEIFPSIRSIEIKNDLTMNRTPPSCFAYHFPHLKEFNLDAIVKEEWKVFELNPQLRRIQINKMYNIEHLRRISETLQNLEFVKFGIEFPLPRNPDEANKELIHFRNVKRCELDIGLRNSNQLDIIPFVFDDIEEMNIRSWYMLDNWIAFFVQHNSLKVLNYSNYMNGQELLSITENLRNLHELNIQKLFDIRDDVETRLMRSLMSSETNLNKITAETTIRNCELFRNSLNSRWNIENDPIQEKRVTLIRKKTNFQMQN